jgi:hypothetical protein
MYMSVMSANVMYVHAVYSETYMPCTINDTPYSTTFSYWQKRISTTLQRYNAKILQQAQYKIARVTGLLHEDHTDLNHTILIDRHIYDVGI